ncbi:MULTISPECIES: metalloregulator ArsR/SmtB family transcription factor [unclassified Meiothermus]|uniref:helix-turn-helix transcriptional regulator n=1 Tax=unclassified Meiothermus TaxID=370471 RepID=UPI000D7BC11F|nr:MULTISPECIES: ArsR family transcriptional regulator [unclassified Meiothermus]PZA06602.1 transcriptional regulator [Meiothermus sp. Pnk-1]RYM37705.1 ArsR family transcriptional regulator [Meiothermus sp. PNK-Is4]
MVGLGDTKLKILERLRTQAASVTDLADEMGISRVAVHKHLEDLMREGLVRARVEKCEGRGRPKQVFVAVDEQAGYVRLCDEVLVHLKELFGAGAVLQVLSRRNERLAETLAPRLAGLSLEDKLCVLAGYLTEQGYQARCYEENGHWYLEQGRCPKLALSSGHAELCQAELQLYERLLGVPVVREERIAAGGECCRYRIG